MHLRLIDPLPILLDQRQPLSQYVSPEDLAHYGEAYWQDFYDNCPIIGLVCQK